MKRIICLAPHPDDGELGCGGTLAKYREEGDDVYYVVLSNCNESLPKEFPEGTLMKELIDATRVLGIPAHNIIKLDHPVRNFPECRQEILDDLILLKQEIKPDIIFMPGPDDIHQDHNTVYNEGFRAFKYSNIFCYELPWNNTQFRTNTFAILRERHVLKKELAISQYQSQKHRPYTTDLCKNLARVRGVQAGADYAEAFEGLRFRI